MSIIIYIIFLLPIFFVCGAFVGETLGVGIILGMFLFVAAIALGVMLVEGSSVIAELSELWKCTSSFVGDDNTNKISFEHKDKFLKIIDKDDDKWNGVYIDSKHDRKIMFDEIKEFCLYYDDCVQKIWKKNEEATLSFEERGVFDKQCVRIYYSDEYPYFIDYETDRKDYLDVAYNVLERVLTNK